MPNSAGTGAPTSAIAIRLDQELQERLKALGKARDRSAHHLMKDAIARYVEAEERLEAEKQIMRDRYTAYEVTGEYIAHEDMKSWARSLSHKTNG